jgi:hypothetical protein
VALLRPLGATANEVSYGLGQGGYGSAETGVQGLYSDFADAYRRAADYINKRDGTDLLPRELQSITWEGLRGLWSQVEKGKKSTIDRVNDLWGDYMAGRKTQAEVQREILGERGENIKPPRWWGSFGVNPMDQALARHRELQPRRWGGRIS